MRFILLVVFLPSVVLTQTIHEVPFATSGNVVELTIRDVSGVGGEKVEVKIEDWPVWVHFTERSYEVMLDEGGIAAAVFSFAVDRSAPVGEEGVVSFRLTDSRGGRWTKGISLRVTPPEEFILFQNYPNPFNPLTTIGYQLPAAGTVVLKVHNLIGQEVATLVDGVKPAGFHQEMWDAGGYSSGLYVAEIRVEMPGRERMVSRRRMMVLK